MNDKPKFFSIVTNPNSIFSPSPVENGGTNPSTLLLFATFLYLALPAGLFLAGWFRLEVAIPGIIALVAVACLIFRTTSWLPLPKPTLFFWIALVFCCVWVYLSGVGHFVYANMDWMVRDAVLHDLVVKPWPVVYQTDTTEALLLRAPLGYYLPAAVVGKLVSLPMAYMFLAVWTGLGVLLAFLLIANCFSNLQSCIIAIVVFIGFSGLDLIGTLLTRSEKINIANHLEWWASYFQYSSHTTQLFWVPNHALPGWLGMLLLLAYWNRAALMGWFPAIICAAALWSPLATLGLLPFYLGHVFVHRKTLIQGWLGLLSVSSLALPFGLPIAYYLTLKAGTVPGALLLDRVGGDNFWSHYLLFVILEFGILATLLSRFNDSLPFWIAVATLSVLPFISYGPGNDLAMRASIPALTVLAAMTAHVLTSHADSQIKIMAQSGLILVLLMGAMTAVHEIARAVIESRWEASTSSDVVQASKGAPHYLAVLGPDSLMTRLLRRNLTDDLTRNSIK